MVPEPSVWQDSRGFSEVGVAFQWGRGSISLQKSGQKEDRDIGILCNKEPSPQISGQQKGIWPFPQSRPTRPHTHVHKHLPGGGQSPRLLVDGSILLCSITSMAFQSWSLSPAGLQCFTSVSLSCSGEIQEQMGWEQRQQNCHRGTVIPPPTWVTPHKEGDGTVKCMAGLGMLLRRDDLHQGLGLGFG